MDSFNRRLLTIAATIICLMVVLLPFHAFLTVWASTLVGHYTALRLWKEVLLGVLTLIVIVVAVRERWWQCWAEAGRLRRGLLITVLIYGVCCLLAYILGQFLGQVSSKAAVYGLLLDGRYLLFMLLTWFVAAHRPVRLEKLVLVSAGIVAVIAVLQFAILPPNVLRHFGYGPNTIAVTQTIDQKDAYQRVQSTLRGANPLGAYLVLILALIAARLLKRRTAILIAYLVIALVALLFTFSRGAWLGALLGVGLVLLYGIRRFRSRRVIMSALVSFVVVASLTFVVARSNPVFQNLVFHTDSTSQSAESSNDGHLAALRTASLQVLHQPLGHGLGWAGPASAYNGTARFSENQYLQIAQESGLIGLVAFLLILVILSIMLWERRQTALGLPLLCSLAGLSLVGLLSHVWSDDTLAYIWWGLAGVCLAAGPLMPLTRIRGVVRWLMTRRGRHIAEYFAGGGAYFVSGYLLFALFYSGFHQSWWLSKLIGDVAGWSFNYVVQRYYTFSSRTVAKHESSNRRRYIGFCTFNLFVDYLIIGALQDVGISPYAGMLVAALFFTGWNYLGFRYYVFRKRTI